VVRTQSVRGVAATGAGAGGPSPDAAEPQQQQEQQQMASVDFPYPYIQGHPVDTCLQVEADPGACGKASADWFCRFQRCEAAVSYQESTGDRGPTWVPMDDAVRATGGNSFDLITCSCPVPVAPPGGAEAANQIGYEKPEILGHPVDVCMYKAKKDSCGQPAADAFCASFGSAESVRFEQGDGEVDGPTWLIGDHALNEDADRQTFKSITCV
jgi:hypothetical protein